MHHIHKGFFFLFLWAGLLLSTTLGGQTMDPYHFSFKRELVYLGSGATTTLLGYYLKLKTPAVMFSDLEAEGINRFDRIATTYHSAQADSWSDQTLFASVGLSALLLAGRETRNDFGKIGLLFVETMLINQGLTDIIKSVSRRPRPYVFAETIAPTTILSSEDRASFLSGHTSGAATGAFFFARVFSDYYPDSKLKPYVWGVAISLPALTGYLRVRAGKHYPTDVIAGYALGAGIGCLIPMLHKRPLKSKGLSMAPTSSGFYMSYRF